MISTLTIFNAAYSGLDAYFPAGSEFQVDSPVVLIVGPNGSGKTGLMRMIASSLEYHRYFEEQAISHRWIETLGICPSMEKAISEISQAREVSPGWFAVPYDLEKLTDFLAYRDS